VRRRRAGVRWSLRARRDLLEIGRFIARDDRGAARRWVEKLRERARQAAALPRAGRRVPELERDDVREVLQGSYRIVYLVGERAIEVLTVFEAHRLFPPGRP
jgi:plasmid stabilization system protein ParE